MSPAKPPTPRSRSTREPKSLKMLLEERIMKGEKCCIGNPPPGYNNCRVEIKVPSEIIERTKILAQEEILTHDKHINDLESIAKSFTCPAHRKNQVDFAHYWLAEPLLQKFLDNMQFTMEVNEWICFAQAKSICKLECKKKPEEQRIVYASLHKLALGIERLNKEAIGILTKHWLCKEHCNEKVKWEEYLADRIAPKAWMSNGDTTKQLGGLTQDCTDDGIAQGIESDLSNGAVANRLPVTPPITDHDLLCERNIHEGSSNVSHGEFEDRMQVYNSSDMRDPSSSNSLIDSPSARQAEKRPSSRRAVSAGAKTNGCSLQSSDEAPQSHLISSDIGMGNNKETLDLNRIPDYFKKPKSKVELAGVKKDLLTLMKTPLNKSEKDIGSVYVFQVSGTPDIVKIGGTTRKSEKRRKEIVACMKALKLEPADTKNDSEIKCFMRVEKLVHAELINEQRMPLHPLCECEKEHREWFAVGSLRASLIVEKWRTWMRLEPYSDDGNLKPEWLQKVESFRIIDSEKETESGRYEELLGRASLTSRLSSWLSCYLWAPRQGRNHSRIASLLFNWKDHFVSDNFLPCRLNGSPYYPIPTLVCSCFISHITRNL